MTGVYDEAWNQGGLGPSGVTLLYETVDAVRRFSGFPPPLGHDRWDASAVVEVAHELLSRPAVVAGAIARAVDDESFERVLDVAVRNFLRSQYRTTERGRMMRSLRRVIEGGAGVVMVEARAPGAGCWSVPANAAGAPFAGRVGDLIDAAFSVANVRRARWREDAKHRPPIAEPDSLRRVVRAVLAAAGSPVTPATMLQVVAARFPLADAVSVVALTDVIAEHTPDPRGESPAARLIAEEIWEQLSERERLVAGILDQPVREIAAETGLSRSTTHRTVLAARAVLTEHLQDDDEALSVIGQLRTFSDLLRQNGTRRAALASEGGEET